MALGVIGFGRLGTLFVRYFAKGCPIYVYDSKPKTQAIRALEARPASLSQVCQQEIVLVCVPIRDFESVIKKISPLLGADALVIDVCSVKEYPVKIMKRWLPRKVQILSTHPNFGPDSAADSLKGHQIAICKVRIGARRYNVIKSALRKKGLRILELSPAAHDQCVVNSLVLTHFIGRSLLAYGAKPTGMDTEGYKRLLRILQTVEHDSWQLFEDINRFNAYAKAMRRRWHSAMNKIEKRINL